MKMLIWFLGVGSFTQMFMENTPLDFKKSYVILTMEKVRF